MSGELVHVPRPTGIVRFGVFGEAGSVAYTPPANTLDDRYAACTDHRVACDCREAEWAEFRSEAQADRRALEKVASEILKGHPTYVYGDNEVPCQCTGCQIARAGYLARWPR